MGLIVNVGMARTLVTSASWQLTERVHDSPSDDAYVVPNRQARCNPLGKAAEVLAHPLAQRLESLETRALVTGVNADALSM